MCCVYGIDALLTKVTALNAPVKFDVIVRTYSVQLHEAWNQWWVVKLVRLRPIHSIQSDESVRIARPIDDVEPRDSVGAQLKWEVLDYFISWLYMERVESQAVDFVEISQVNLQEMMIKLQLQRFPK